MVDPPGRLVVGIDVGGTFTDFVAIAAGRFRIRKVPSTPDDPSRAVADGLAAFLADLDLPPSSVSVVLHGTTVATNALLQRRGARTGLITTKGFRDVLEIGRQARPRLFDFDAARPPPLVPRPLRQEVLERLDERGTVMRPLDEASLRGAVDALRKAGVESIAVCYLHAYVDPMHERRTAEWIADTWPEAHISLSSDVVAEYREYERSSTTAINAYVAPVMTRYLSAMEQRLAQSDAGTRLRVMQSNGGVTTVRRSCQLPVATLLSGVAAGALGGVRLAHQAGRSRTLTIDIGGTSCDLALGIDGKVGANRRYEVGGLPVRLPALDIHTIGAGGGSIAWIDAGGALRVGPQSAGAEPGPACYGRGGREPTVTDANLLLGRLPERLIGGRLPLSREAAHEAVARLADRLGLEPHDAAVGIIRVINAGMTRQMRVLTIERGIDPRDCTLVAFGGGGPLHATDLARDLEMPEVMVPAAPGVTSALGLVLADERHDAVKTVLLEPAGAASLAEVEARLEEAFRELERQVTTELHGQVPPLFERAVEMRYRRQGHELTVALHEGIVDAASVAKLEQTFHAAHKDRFGYAMRSEPTVIVNALMSAVIPAEATAPRLRAAPAVRTSERRQAWFDGAWHDTEIVDRSALVVGETRQGPLIIEQLDSTSVVPPGSIVHCDASDNLLIKLPRV
jgi:N-methylhydantoinase A